MFEVGGPSFDPDKFGELLAQPGMAQRLLDIMCPEEESPTLQREAQTTSFLGGSDQEINEAPDNVKALGGV